MTPSLIQAGKIVREELDKARIECESIDIRVSDSNRVGVQGDKRTYRPSLQVAFPQDKRREIYEKCAEAISIRISNEVANVNGVLYTIQ